MTTIPILLTTAQVANRAGKTPSTINRWVKTGKLTPDYEVAGYNGDRLYTAATVLALIQGEADE